MIPDDHPLQKLFLEMVARHYAEEIGIRDPELVGYVAHLLTEFCDAEQLFAFVRALGRSIMPAYLPIVGRRRHDPWGERERRWQLLRRGRYVEFNLLYDRGTIFGLRTDGRIESILMSLPPEVRWEYAASPEPGTPEADSLAAICARTNWAEV